VGYPAIAMAIALSYNNDTRCDYRRGDEGLARLIAALCAGAALSGESHARKRRCTDGDGRDAERMAFARIAEEAYALYVERDRDASTLAECWRIATERVLHK